MLKSGWLKQRRRKLPWYEYLFITVALLVATQISHWLSGLGILIALVGSLAGGFAAGYVAYEGGKRLGERFPTLKSKHVGYFDR